MENKCHIPDLVQALPYVEECTLQPGVNDTTHESVPRQSKFLKNFIKRWKQEYLISLKEHYRYTGRNTRSINVGAVVQIHDDVSRVNWTLVVIDKLVYGKDELTRSTIIRIKNGVTSRPISKLYTLELNSLEVETRAAQCEAKKRIKTWTNAC
ncbi:unnamed protein product [Mytilus coruscus]|uniref:DUF5641 domain-containing protein n=1 Tax=Mytilus coruscus TaxID=42192 RepID=A0A6J8ATR3_MYTCO|nr:unnamed protein product [Mytilus coruscus]